MHSVNINGNIGFIFHSNPANINSIGFFAEKIGSDPLHYRKIVEVSKPIIYSTDHSENLLTLAPIKTSYEYPYSQYIKGDFLENNKKKNYSILRKLKNPDETYAYAMHFLKNGDLPTAQKLLKYLSLREKHIFAMRELGICRWRGIGMKKDYKSALKYFSNATQYGDLESSAYHQLLLFKNITMPHLDEPTARKFIYYQDYKLDEDFFIHLNKMSNPITNYHVFYAASVRQANLMLGIGRSPLIFSPPNPFTITANDKLEYWMTIKKHHDLYLNKQSLIPSKENFYEQFEEDTSLFGKPNKKGDFKHIKLPANCFFRGQIMIRRWAQERRSLDEQNIKDVEEKEKEIKKINELLKGAMTVFKRGVEMNNDADCALEILQCKLRLDKIKKADFTKEIYYKYADYPLYYLLRYAVKNPRNLAMKEFLKCNYETAIAMLEKKKTTENIFLQAAIGLYFYHHLDKMYYYSRAIIADYNPITLSRLAPKPDYYTITSLKNTFLKLDKAITRNHNDAMYLKSLLELDRKYSLRARELFIGENDQLLRRIVNKNHPMALYKFIELSMRKTKCFVRPQWLKQLKPLRDAKHAGAWLLTGDILVQTRGINEKNRPPLINIYEKALKYGSLEALDRIAKVYYNSNKENILEKSTPYWKEYMVKVNEQRKYDEFDFYSEDPHELKSYTVYEVFKDKKIKYEDQIGNDLEDLIKINTNIPIGEKGVWLEAFSQRHNFTNNIVIYDIENKPVHVKSKKGIEILKRLFEQYDLEVPPYIIEPKAPIINDQQNSINFIYYCKKS